MAGGMIVVLDSQLCAAIGQVRDANLFARFLQNKVEAAERHGRKVLAVRVAGPVLHGAGNAHITLSLGEPRGNLSVIHPPVLTEPIEVGGLEIDVAKTRGRASPKIRFSASRLATLPVPIRPGRIGVLDIVLE